MKSIDDINEGENAMRILLVCDAIAPQQSIASIRWTKLQSI